MGRNGSCAFSGMPITQNDPCVKVMPTKKTVEWFHSCEVKLDTYNAQDREWRYCVGNCIGVTPFWEFNTQIEKNTFFVANFSTYSKVSPTKIEIIILRILEKILSF